MFHSVRLELHCREALEILGVVRLAQNSGSAAMLMSSAVVSRWGAGPRLLDEESRDALRDMTLRRCTGAERVRSNRIQQNSRSDPIVRNASLPIQHQGFRTTPRHSDTIQDIRRLTGAAAVKEGEGSAPPITDNGEPFALQKFIKSRGPHAFIVRQASSSPRRSVVRNACEMPAVNV